VLFFVIIIYILQLLAETHNVNVNREFIYSAESRSISAIHSVFNNSQNNSAF